MPHSAPSDIPILQGSTVEERLKIEQRFWKFVEVQDSGCWQWVGVTHHSGYGRISVRNRSRTAHRVSYELYVGEIPPGRQLDHLCRNRACIRPSHLEAVQPTVNVRRSTTPAVTTARNQRRPKPTHCPHGHEFTEANSGYQWVDEDRGLRQRYCRRCRIIINLRNQREKREARAAERKRPPS